MPNEDRFDHVQDAPRERPQDLLSMLSEISGRLTAVERDNADLRSQLDNARKGGRVEPYEGFLAHVSHIMTKHFYHDRPEPEVASKAA